MSNKKPGFKYTELQSGGGHLIMVRRMVGGQPKWGFMDGKGVEVIPCRYDFAEPFSEGLAHVSLDGADYFIDEAGAQVIRCEAGLEYGSFEDGLCQVIDADEEVFYFMDRSGLPVISKQPYWGKPAYGEGIISAGCGDFFSRNGKRLKMKMDWYYNNEWVYLVCGFREGLCAFSDGENDIPTGYINQAGDVVIAPRDLDFYNSYSFNERLASASHTKYGRYGFLDQRGKEVISFTYTNAGDFHGGLAAVSMEGAWGFIDREDNMLIPCQFGMAGWHFPEFDDAGLCILNGEGGLGVINKAGRVVVPFQYQYVGITESRIAALGMDGHIEWYEPSLPDSEGYVYLLDYADADVAKVAQMRGGRLLWGFIDRDGKEVVPCEYEEVMFMDGVCRVRKDGLWGLYDTDGKQLAPCRYDSAFAPFRDGLSAVQRKGLWGFVNRRGQETIHCKWDAVEDFVEERCTVLHEGKYGAIDSKGRIVIPIENDFVRPFSEGLTGVRKGNTWHVADKDGHFITDKPVDGVGTCSEGLIGVRSDGRSAFLDRTGKQVLNLGKAYDRISSFHEGLCAVSKDYKWGYIDRAGKLVIPCCYSHPYFNTEPRFQNGLALFQSEKEWRCVGAIDRSGNEALPPVFRRLYFLSDELLYVHTGTGVGVYNKEMEEIIVPPVYDGLDVRNGVIRVVKDGCFGILSLTGETLVPCERPYDTLVKGEGDIYITGKDGLFGVTDPSGKELIPVVYRKLARIDGRLAMLDEKGWIHLFLPDGTPVNN